MTYPNTAQLREWLSADYPVMAAMESFEFSDADFNRHYAAVSRRPEGERRDAAAFNCLTFGVVKDKPKETKPEQILIQQDQFLRVQSAHLEETKARHGAVMIAVDSARGDIGRLALTALEIQESCGKTAEFCDVIEAWQESQAKRIDRSDEYSRQRWEALGEGMANLHARQQELVSRKPMFPKWLVVAFAVLMLVLFGVDIAYGQNVNPATVVAVCGTPPSPYPSAGNRAPTTVDVNGQVCATASLTVTPPANQNVTIIGMSSGVFPVTTAGQSYSNAMAIQGVTGGIPAPVSTLGPLAIVGTGAAGTATASALTIQGNVSGVPIPTTMVTSSGAPLTITGAIFSMYAAATVVASAASATDVFTLTGSASFTVCITGVTLSGTATALTVPVSLIKRSTANSGGTSAAVAIVPFDSTAPAASATVLAYTANPTLGTLVGALSTQTVPFVATTGGGNPNSIDIPALYRRREFETPIALRGTGEVLAINFNATSITAPAMRGGFFWYEKTGSCM